MVIVGDWDVTLKLWWTGNVVKLKGGHSSGTTSSNNTHKKSETTRTRVKPWGWSNKQTQKARDYPGIHYDTNYTWLTIRVSGHEHWNPFSEVHSKPVNLSKWTHIMFCLGKWSTQRGMYSVTARITVKAHPNKQGTINVITMYTNQILSDKSNP